MSIRPRSTLPRVRSGELLIALAVFLTLANSAAIGAFANDDASPTASPATETAPPVVDNTPTREPTSPTQTPEPTTTTVPTATATESPPADPVLNCDADQPIDVMIGSTVDIGCDVTIRDSRAGFRLLVVPADAWLVRDQPGDLWSTNRDAPEQWITDVTGTTVRFSVPVTAPSRTPSNGRVDLVFYSQTQPDAPLITLHVDLIVTVPSEWTLECDLAEPNILAGTSTTVACSLPKAAWAISKNSAIASIAYIGGKVEINLNSPHFTHTLTLDCLASGEIPIDIVADLANGVVLRDSVVVVADASRTGEPVVLTQSAIAFGSTTWDGSQYPPVSSTVTLTIETAPTPCAAQDWTILATTAQFSDGINLIDLSIAFSLESTSFPSLETATATGVIDPATPVVIASGSGSGDITLQLTLALPPATAVGSYSGEIAFDLAAAP